MAAGSREGRRSVTSTAKVPQKKHGQPSHGPRPCVKIVSRHPRAAQGLHMLHYESTRRTSLQARTRASEPRIGDQSSWLIAIAEDSDRVSPRASATTRREWGLDMYP
ncbi:hypothetical protein LTR53_017260, partial [Teratosphaeriaceae sp. CCFEE 6253]